ncbi:uncharacterized protein LOC135150817 [Daucus carota subsp. sativus]|uniref:uncharacterized protein LOC135150817 n=1 Tax=Daucus carota subsp. sativus TaxID=79200 RepID=UPI00308389DE
MEHAINSAAPNLIQEQSILQGLFSRVRGAQAPPRRRGPLPITPVEPEPGTYYTHVASSSSDMRGWSHLVGTSRSPVRDVPGTSGAGGWPRWVESSTYAADIAKGCAEDDYEGGESGFAVNLEDDEYTSAEGGHTPVAPLQESYQFLDRDAYRLDMSFLADQYTTPPPQAPVLSFGSPSYVFGAPAFPLTPAPVRSTPTPIPMHNFGSYVAESSPWPV